MGFFQNKSNPPSGFIELFAQQQPISGKNKSSKNCPEIVEPESRSAKQTKPVIKGFGDSPDKLKLVKQTTEKSNGP